MHYLRWTSYAITLAGIVLAVVAGMAGLGEVWLLAGILLAWAGIVKIIVVVIWEHVADLKHPENVP